MTRRKANHVELHELHNTGLPGYGHGEIKAGFYAETYQATDEALDALFQLVTDLLGDDPKRWAYQRSTNAEGFYKGEGHHFYYFTSRADFTAVWLAAHKMELI